ncbi:MAG: hypothetical protein IJT45_02505, partial [Bacteroidales bacterium]|nr:hypothetical protein [Bacteroidales bacterium]
PIELGSQDKAVTGMKAINEGGEAYIMYNKANKNEYFLLENRQKTGWDAYLPDDGLMITHVDYDEEKFAYNVVNSIQPMHYDEAYAYVYDYYTQYAEMYGMTLEEFLEEEEMTAEEFDEYAKENAAEAEALYNPHQRMTIVHADNDDDQAYYDADTYSYEMQTIDTDLYPIEGNNVFDNNSKPAAKLYNANSDGRNYLNHGVENITQNTDGTISFNFKAKSVKELPEVGTVLLHETFDKCAGTGGNDGKWSGSIATAAFTPDYDGEDDWYLAHYTVGSQGGAEEYDGGKGFGANKCAKFGSGSYFTVAMSPFFEFYGKVTISFKAAAWNANKDKTDLTVLLVNNDDDTDVELGKETMLKGQWTEYSYEAEGDGTYYLYIQPAIAYTRYFLDDVKVVYTEQPQPTGIKQVNVEKQVKDNRIYTIDGRYVGTSMNSLQRGIYIVNGKKIVK